ncbi:gamma-glutamylcyclotransferase family protein [Faecalispora anaeroviscerum]|uniref:gamma-glutamylcyclotransferase family protein n=1 Tax=Faecalispora anaeroviscerum TaxID=2991836 RepID=UPI0024BB89FE|nr:gamma-glutamylcyclotransferase family protein [Faecalispora anaeroviscerum]
MKSKILYIAYGSNLNLPQMAFRCPTAKIVGVSEIKDYELLFRGGGRGSVATVEPLKGSNVPILLWALKDKDLQSLDRYEGYLHFYRKGILDVELGGRNVPAMVYVMNDGHQFGSPSDYYLNTIMEGYKSVGFDTDFLEQAVEKSVRLAQEQQAAEPEQGSLFGPKWW